jgi:hypothetical protein
LTSWPSMCMWMRSAYRIVCWCWIWMQLRVGILGSSGAEGDGVGVLVLVSLSLCLSGSLALLGGRVCSWQVPPRSAAIASACHRGPPFKLAIHANRSALAASPSHEPSALARSNFFPFCSSLFAPAPEPDGRARRPAAAWSSLSLPRGPGPLVSQLSTGGLAEPRHMSHPPSLAK